MIDLNTSRKRMNRNGQDSLQCHYLASGSCGNKRGLFQAWCPSRFSPISLHDFICAISDGFSQVSCFFLLRFPIVHFAFSSVVFCLNFNPFLKNSLVPCQVFFLYLFICLYINIIFPKSSYKNRPTIQGPKSIKLLYSIMKSKHNILV